MKPNQKIEQVEPTLTPTDKHSAVWRKLVKHYETRLVSLRAQNDNPLNEAATAVLRGRIQEVKGLLRLNEELPIIE
jgi:hypothetical protein